MSSPGTPRAHLTPHAPLPHSKSDDSLVEDDLVPDQSSPETSRLADDIGSLTSMDIRADPILSSLARKQAQTPTNPPTAFKARPAPNTLRQEGVGPRMTKAAALRQGLQWEGNTAVGAGKSSKTVSCGEDGPMGRERKEVDFAHVPGHKREGLGIAVASLSTPSIAPRETKASKLRTGGAVTVPGEKRDMAAAAAAAKAREREENMRKRASIALPASLAAPQIAPRANRSSQLRTAGPMSPPTSTSRPTQALKANSSATNVRSEAVDEAPRVKAPYEEKVNRRASMAGVKSLGAPSIMPRANKSSMLRAPGAPNSTATSPTTPSTRPSRPSTSSGGAPSFGSIPSLKAAARPSTSAGADGPRPTKASLLRAGLGVAKVPIERER